MSHIESLEPMGVWSAFAEISRVPRGSGNEAAVMAMLEGWARKRGLATKRDRTGNMLVSIPATPGREADPSIVLQGHADMVCEKDGATPHDFTKDPIRLRVDGDWVTATGTTLGADNGLGVAMALAVAEDRSVHHGPVEVLVTIDEERGLTGASGIEEGFFSAKRMINLDSEEDDGIYIGCAGGRDTVLTLRAPRAAAEGAAIEVRVGGLLGGHSGLDIIRNRGNAIRLLARLLLAGAAEASLRLIRFEGGNLRNAIPREARAALVVPSGGDAAVVAAIRAAAERIRSEELAGIDDGFAVECAACPIEPAMAEAQSIHLVRLLVAIPNGVAAMSQMVEGLVETSSNLGVVRCEGEAVRITCCSRSSVMSSLDGMALQHRCLGEIAGAEIDQPQGYPGWKPNPDSRLLARTQEEYRRVFGCEPKLKAIHAGLECGLFTAKYPGLEIVSFGPNIEGAHSPRERASISSTARVYRLLTAILEREG